MELEIEVKYADLLPKIKQHLAIVGKRAKTVDGKPMFSDISSSTNEDPVFAEMIEAGAHNLMATLRDMAIWFSHIRNPNRVSVGLKFKLSSNRWVYDTEEVVEALQDSLIQYLYNYALAQYLTDIHPSTGAKYPPLYGQTYIEHCAVIINTIRELAFLKRAPIDREKSYADIKAEKVMETLAPTPEMPVTPKS